VTAPARFIKRSIDLVGACVGIVVFSPVMLAAAITIRRTSPGPILFRQCRVGENGKVYQVYKFRSLTHGAPQVLSSDGSAAIIEQNDPRVTTVGKFLRRTSIDELPQLFNVLRGEMSLVGPRPEQPEGIGSYAPHQYARLTVKPGLTGWAVIHGRNNVPVVVRRDLDAWYAQHQTLGLDLKILLRTAQIVFRREGINPLMSEDERPVSEPKVQA
jgi:lipopolysaccharide/colanic/teichoic acid biosynthesis glycosyltransferase